MHIPEIPPFRNKSADSVEHTGSSASNSPQQARVLLSTVLSQNIPEIPPLQRQRLTSEHCNTPIVLMVMRAIISKSICPFHKYLHENFILRYFSFHFFRIDQIKTKKDLNRNDSLIDYQIGYLVLR